MLNTHICLITIYLAFATCISAYRILGVFPIPIPSHYFLGSSLMRALAEAGHDVSIIAPFKDKEVPSLYKNGSYREIVIEEILESYKKSKAKIRIKINFSMTYCGHTVYYLKTVKCKF